MAKIGHTGAWKDIYEFLRHQQPGTHIAWRVLSEVAGHDVRASRTALKRAEQVLALDHGLAFGRDPAGIEVQSLA